jgi:hypothetical protein
MDTKQLTALLTGAVIISSGLTYTATELTGEEVLKEGEETPIVEEVPAVQPTIIVDDECGEDSLKLLIGTAEMCTGSEVYGELKQVVVDDLKKEKSKLQLADGTLCEEESEECKKVNYDLELQNRELFYSVLVKEMLKDGEIKNLSDNPAEAKIEALAILEGTTEGFQIINK